MAMLNNQRVSFLEGSTSCAQTSPRTCNGCNEVLDECHEASSGCISEVYLVSWEDTPVNKLGAFWYSLVYVCCPPLKCKMNLV